MRKGRRFWLTAGGTVLLGFLGVVFVTDYRARSFRQKQANIPGTPVLTVLGARYDVTWKEIAVSEFQKPEWGTTLFGWDIRGIDRRPRSEYHQFSQTLFSLHVGSIVPGGAYLTREVEARGEVSAGVRDCSINFHGGTGFGEVMFGKPRVVLQRKFDANTNIYHVRIGWSFPNQTTGKTCDLIYRLTPEGFVFLEQGDPNTAPAGGGGS